jgi:hypothetical protein
MLLVCPASISLMQEITQAITLRDKLICLEHTIAAKAASCGASLTHPL